MNPKYYLDMFRSELNRIEVDADRLAHEGSITLDDLHEFITETRQVIEQEERN